MYKQNGRDINSSKFHNKCELYFIVKRRNENMSDLGIPSCDFINFKIYQPKKNMQVPTKLLILKTYKTKNNNMKM